MASLFRQKSTYVYLAGSVIFIIIALIVGIDDNLPGIILLFISSILLVLAFTHNWKRKSYILLIVFSLAGFVVSVILHNIFETSGGEVTFLGILSALFFLVAIFLCPVCLLIGIIGSIMKSLKKTEAKLKP
jgi:hypothetical protein